MISIHMQFFIAYLIALGVTGPLLGYAWRRCMPHVMTMTRWYVVGYAIIGITFIIDDRFDPPLFFHGFIPGIGIGMLLDVLILFIWDAQTHANAMPPSVPLNSRRMLFFGIGSLLLSATLHTWFVGGVFEFYTGIFAGLPIGLLAASPILPRVEHAD
jgi:hypothetical protein